MFRLEEDQSRIFVEKKTNYNIISQAHKLVKQVVSDMDDLPVVYAEEVAKISALKSKSKEEHLEEISRVLDKYFGKRVVQESNMIKIGEGWYGIVYSNRKKLDLKIDYISENDISFLERRTGEEYHSRIDLEAVLPACINDILLEIYKNSLEIEARRLLEKEAPYCFSALQEEVPAEEGSKGMGVSIHAQKRWIQRRLKVEGLDTDSKVEFYRREHTEEVTSQVLEGLYSANKVWEDVDGTSYFFDESNMMYIVGNNSVITVYEENFGFSKSINRSIVLQQLEVLRQSKGILDKEIEEYECSLSKISASIEKVDSKISRFELALSKLREKRDALVGDRKGKRDNLMKKRLDYEKEYNKLFKKPITWMGREE